LTSSFCRLLGTESQDAAAKCLAFAGDIHSGLWAQYGQASPRMLLMLRTAKAAALRIDALLHSLPARAGPNDHGGYLGYDERDVSDYDIEGYSVKSAELQELVPQIQESIMVWLLLLYQLFSEPLPNISKKVVSCRTRKNTAGRYSSRRMLKASQGAVAADLTTDVFAADAVLDNLDLVAYFTELAGMLLGLLLRRGLAEDAHNNCVKVVVLLNAQLPRLQHADTNEVGGFNSGACVQCARQLRGCCGGAVLLVLQVAALFAATDSGQAGDNLSQVPANTLPDVVVSL
jgi:hypothetical protein